LPSDPPTLDMRVKMVFDEDFRTMNFPKVKSLLFRVSSSSPFEVAAKALALKNGHPELWKSYTFSIITKDPHRNTQQEEEESLSKTYREREVFITDLRKLFSSFKRDHFSHNTEEEVVFFYKINSEAFKSAFLPPNV
jgi:hypothetical protein